MPSRAGQQPVRREYGHDDGDCESHTGTCETESGATWLQVTPVAASGGIRPLVNEIAGPTWGYHFQDINLSLGNLVDDVHAAETAYSS